jgi:glycerol-3-phosphate acyltransferase PlsY
MEAEIAVAAAAYLFGAVPFGLLLAKLAGIDVRAAGSGNIGATNVARTAGKTLGALTLVLDAAKGAAPVLVATRLGFDARWLAGIGLAAILGHVFPIYLRFRGGKGVATALGVFLALSWQPTLLAIGAFALVFLASRYVSLGSLAGAAVLTGSSWFLDGRLEVSLLACLATGLIVVRHRGNIRRMRDRSEHAM